MPETLAYTLQDGPSAGQTRPALVTSVNDDKTVNLSVFVEARDGLCPSGIMQVRSVNLKTGKQSLPEPPPPEAPPEAPPEPTTKAAAEQAADDVPEDESKSAGTKKKRG